MEDEEGRLTADGAIAQLIRWGQCGYRPALRLDGDGWTLSMERPREASATPPERGPLMALSFSTGPHLSPITAIMAAQVVIR